MFVSVIVLAAGKGTRFGSRVPKPLATLAGRPVVEHCLRTFRGIRMIRQLILVVSPAVREGAEAAARRAGWRGDCCIVSGGERRQDSVRNALDVLDPRCAIVLIHDGVRPLVSEASISAVIRKASTSGAAVCAVPAKATIKRVSAGRVQETLRRDELWEAQTPQGFRKDAIVSAYRAVGAKDVTDDASLVESLGLPVHIVPGEYANIKITTPGDLRIAGALIKSPARER